MKTFFLLISLTSFAALADRWVINPDHSELMFQVPYLKVAEVTGRFNKFKGEMDLEQSEISLLIDSASIDTGNKMRDGHLRGQDFFKSKEYPSILFTSNKVQKLKSGLFEAMGDLTIKKITRPFTIQFSLTDSVKDTWGYENKFVKFKSSLNRKDFDLKWNKTLEGQQFLVGDEITFYGTMQIQPMSSKTPGNKHMIPDTSYIRYRESLARGEKLDAINAPVPPILNETKVAPAEIPKTIVPSPTTVNVETEYRESLSWWVAFILLGFFGFMGVTMIGIYSKKALLTYSSRHYEETGILGIVSDAAVIGMVFIYSVAFWFVGWA